MRKIKTRINGGKLRQGAVNQEALRQSILWGYNYKLFSYLRIDAKVYVNPRGLYLNAFENFISRRGNYYEWFNFPQLPLSDLFRKCPRDIYVLAFRFSSRHSLVRLPHLKKYVGNKFQLQNEIRRYLRTLIKKKKPGKLCLRE